MLCSHAAEPDQLCVEVKHCISRRSRRGFPGDIALTFRSIIVVLFFLYLSTGKTCWAWHTLMHLHITQKAFSYLPADVQKEFQPHLSAILWGSLAPDVVLRDWPNHEWNVHSASCYQGSGPSRIEGLCSSIVDDLSREPREFAHAAYKMGLLSHYLADLNQPLHTDEYSDDELWVHSLYEMDAFTNQQNIPYTFRGTEFRLDSYQMAVASAERANRYYEAIIRAYAEGDGYANAEGITALNLQRAVDDIHDTWLTLWYSATSAIPSLTLHMNKKVFEPGDTARISLSVLPGQCAQFEANVYVVLAAENGNAWFLGPGSTFHAESIAWREAWTVSASAGEEILSGLIDTATPKGSYTVYVLLVPPGADPMEQGSWLSNLAQITFSVQPLSDIQLEDLRDEIYLFPACWPETDRIVALPLKRWDFIFLGDQEDDLSTPQDESVTDKLIPGRFNHALVYLGRDDRGTPYGMEMTTNLQLEGPYLRIISFSEFETSGPGSEDLNLPIMTKDVWRYHARWAKRLDYQELCGLMAVEDGLFTQLQEDWNSGFSYQLEYIWSGDFRDKAIYLVDDGREGGSGCTDYWLSLLEEFGGVCIHGSRITADELEIYYRFDPEGSSTVVPEPLNPFSFPLTVKAILDMGFYPVDPPPHVFSCDNSTETGLPIPDRLLNYSPQLVDIAPAPTVPDWQNSN